jgi:hypothetical protein
MRLRTSASVCNRSAPGPAVRGGVLASAVIVAFLAGCQATPATVWVSLSELESAPRTPCAQRQRLVATDPDALRTVATPLGDRLGLLQVRSATQWQQLQAAVPDVGPCPDLSSGSMIGLICWAGTPLTGRWPIHIDAVRVHRGAGMLEGSFQGGSYLPDGSACIETAYVPRLRSVLAVDVGGTTFYPD